MSNLENEFVDNKYKIKYDYSKSFGNIHPNSVSVTSVQYGEAPFFQIYFNMQTARRSHDFVPMVDGELKDVESTNIELINFGLGSVILPRKLAMILRDALTSAIEKPE